MTDIIFPDPPDPDGCSCKSRQDGTVHLDRRRGRSAAGPLYSAFRAGGTRGQNVLPGDRAPGGVARGSREHLLFVTLTAAIDDRGDSTGLWNSSRLAYENPASAYLYEPAKLDRAPFKKIVRDMQKFKLGRKTIRDAQIWTTISTILLRDYDSNPQNLLAAGNFEYGRITRILLESLHGRGKNKRPDFPNLREPEIGLRWFRMLRDHPGIPLKGMEAVPIPVDIHVALSTLCLGVIKGRYEGPLLHLRDPIREAWSGPVESAALPDGPPIIALDLVGPLQRLSRWGCSTRNAEGTCAAAQDCPCRDYCTPGLIEINTKNNFIRFDTG